MRYKSTDLLAGVATIGQLLRSLILPDPVVLQPLQTALQGFQADPAWEKRHLLLQIRRAWPEVVGSVVATHTDPVRIQREVLQVATSTAAWAQNLAFQRQLILVKLNPNLARPLEDIRFLPGEWHRQRSQIGSLASEELKTDGAIPDPDRPKLPPAQTPQEAFQRWARRVKESQLTMYPCPACSCPAPREELDRWFVCGFCRHQHPRQGTGRSG